MKKSMSAKTFDSAPPMPSLLAQAFYLSRSFQRLEMETRDYRLHPVLGGISSTRWNAYERFSRKNSLLVDRLKGRQLLGESVKTVGNRKEAKGLKAPDLYGFDWTTSSRWRMRDEGVLVGDRRANRLQASDAGGVLMGGGGNDLMIGGRGEDVLVGGKGADQFRFRRRDRRGEPKTDTVIDFQPEQGDQIEINGASSFVGSAGFSGRAGEVQATIWMIQGVTLAVDDDGDRQPDGLIELPGLGEFRQDWITF